MVAASVKEPAACSKVLASAYRERKGSAENTQSEVKLGDLSVFTHRVKEEKKKEKAGGAERGRRRCSCMSGSRPLFQKMQPGLGTS